MDLSKRKLRCPLGRLRSKLGGAVPVRDFARALRVPGSLSLIAELKKASPSAGALRLPYDVAGGARDYARAGARAISVLTEENYFAGRLTDLTQAKSASALPVLRKDFIFDDYQIFESRASGADAVLLIVSLLREWELASFVRTTRRLGMTPLVEVHDAEELASALRVGAPVLGVNCRNLKDLTIDTALFGKLIPKIPRDRIIVAESGIRGPEDVKKLKRLKIDAFLVGESLLRRRDLESAARVLVEAGQWA